MGKTVRARKAWAIIDRRGFIHLDKIMASKPEAWGLIAEEMSMSIADCKSNGYDCRRVEIRASTPTGEKG